MKKNRLLQKIKMDLIKQKMNSKHVFFQLKIGFNYNQIKQVLDGVKRGKLRGRELLYKNKLPKEYAELRSGEMLFCGQNLKQELVWSFTFIHQYSSIINDFLSLKEKFERNLLQGNYSEAKNTIDTIEKNIGISIWSIEMKFLLYEYLEGIHKNKEFLHQINKNNNEGFIAFLADFFSFRAEQNISFAQFNNKINKFLENFKEVNAAKSYFKFKLNYSSTFTEKELFDTLWIESKSSIIDIYMTTLKVSQLLSIGDFSDDLKYIVMRNSQELEGLIKDYKISNLIRYYKPELPIAFEEFSKEMVEIGSNYTMGEYKHVFEACKTLIKRRPDCFEIYEYYIKSAMYLNKINLIKNKEASSLSEEIIDIMCSLYNKNTYTEEAASKLLKIIILLSSLDINSHLVHFLSNRVLKDIDKHMLMLAELNSTHTNPRFCRVFENNSTSLKFIKNLKNVYQGHNLIETYEAFYKQELEGYVHTQEIPIPKLRYDRYIAILLNKIGQSDQAIKKLTNLLESDLVSCPTDVHGYLYEKIIIDLYNIHLKQESYKECLKIYVDNYLINSHLTMRLSSSELINFLDYEDEEEIKKDISVPIFYYTFYKNKYEDVYPSYANFMDYSGYERPTQIPVPKDNEQKRKLVFFLKHVCSVEVMVTSIYFDDEQDVRRERINICKILHDIDAENKEEYVKEMSEITQKLRINQRVKQVDESRISIDVKGIRNDDSILYKEGFNRYKKMKGLPETYTVVDINNIDQISKLNETSTVNIIIPGKNQQFVLLKETLIELRDNFIFNEKYGLEPSLSSRIRHGALMNEMRSPFELNNLILSKNTQDSGRYNISSHWKSKLQEYGIDEVLEERLRNILGEFSKKIDEKINEINHEWLRIRTEKRNSNGLFDYTINDFTVLDLFYFFENKDLEKAEEFFDLVMMYLWDETDKNLERIRNKIDIDLKNDLLNYLEELNNDVESIEKVPWGDSLKRDLKNKIVKARTDIQERLNKISQWFIVSHNKDNSDYDINLLIDTFVELAKTLYPSHNHINIKKNVNCTSTFRGISFEYFIDILNNLFNNAVKHSLINEFQQLIIKISIKEDEKYINLEMENNYSDAINKSLLKEKITEIRNKITDEKFIKQYTSKEGGSGYAKIAKILHYNLQSQPYIDWHLDDNNVFKVRIRINKLPIINIEKTKEQIKDEAAIN